MVRSGSEGLGAIFSSKMYPKKMIKLILTCFLEKLLI